MTAPQWPSHRTTRRIVLSWGAAAVALVCSAGLTSAQAADNWPTKSLRVIVPYTPGGATDTVARTVMDKLGQRLKQTIIVENRPGANGTVGTAAGARSDPDGYSFVMVLAAHAANPSLYKNLPYKPGDLMPVSHIADLPLFLFVNNDIPATSVQEFIAYAKKNEGKLNYASSGTGSSAHMTGAYFAMKTGLKMTHIPYKGSAPFLADLMGGQVSMAFDASVVPMPQARAGKLKVLAVASEKRWPDNPDTPTVQEAGVPDFVMNSWAGLMAPAGTPQPVIDRMSREIAEVVKMPEVQKTFTTAGFLPIGGSPAEFSSLIERDSKKYAEIIESAGVTVQ